MVQVKERSLQEIKSKYESLATDLTKMEYLESVLKTPDIGTEIKKYSLGILSELYAKKLMFDKSANALFRKAGYETTYREKIDTYIKAGEAYARSGNIVGAEDMFTRASREANAEQQNKIILIKKNTYFRIASELESKSRMSYASKFYEHLLTLKLDEQEKTLAKNKLTEYYKKIGKFNELEKLKHR